MYINSIIKLFESFLTDFKFIKPVHFFPPGKGFQQLEIEICDDINYKINSDGFCVAWSLWYIELRLQNPNIPRKILVKKTLNSFSKEFTNKDSKNKNDICKVIRDYSEFLMKLDSNKSFFQKNLLFLNIYKVEYMPLIKTLIGLSLYVSLIFSILH